MPRGLHRARRGPAFTLIELLVVISIIGLLISILLPSLGKARASARQVKDATQVRGIHQTLVIWAQNNQGDYPLPSKIDTMDFTMDDQPAVNKDNLGNIMSLLIWNGFVPTEMMISPAEVSQKIREDLEYELDAPPMALEPELALWDPGFTGVASEQGSGLGQGRRHDGYYGNVSYATDTPFGERRRKWANTYSSDEAIIGNRGPIYGGTAKDGWQLAPGSFGQDSLTLKIHGGPKSWEGNVAYNDSRVVFETNPDPEHLNYVFKGLEIGERTQNDNLFVNEDDYTGGADFETRPQENFNAFLRQYSNVKLDGDDGLSITPYWD